MDWISGLGQTAAGIIGALNAPKTPDTTKKTETETPAWLWPVLIIGGGIALVVVLIAVLKD